MRNSVLAILLGTVVCIVIIMAVYSTKAGSHNLVDPPRYYTGCEFGDSMDDELCDKFKNDESLQPVKAEKPKVVQKPVEDVEKPKSANCSN